MTIRAWLWVVLAAVIVLIVAAYFLGGSVLESPGTVPTTGDALPAPVEDVDDPLASSLREQGSSTDPAAIEADLNATALDGLDEDLSAIDAELEGEGL